MEYLVDLDALGTGIPSLPSAYEISASKICEGMSIKQQYTVSAFRLAAGGLDTPAEQGIQIRR